ncbi:MAG: putative sugar nucleotidyl transferase [Planctomycetota bacterium]
MTMIVLFDDAPLAPLTDLRASFQVRSGALTLLERVRLAFGEPMGIDVGDGRASIVHEHVGLTVPAAEDAIQLSGRCVVPPDDLLSLEPGTAWVDADGLVIAAYVRKGQTRDTVSRHLREDIPVLNQPWDVIRYRTVALEHDLRLLMQHAETGAVPEHVAVLGDSGIRVDPSARLHPGVVLDAESGPIVVAEDVVVRPNAIITGPAVIGPGSTVLDGAVIRAHTAIGPVCKVNGEVSGTIFQGYANKAHDGFIGDSWVGEWANLGAGTITSNLLNTYGEIKSRAAPGDDRTPTGLTFFGSILGDHVKTAIGTRLMTGSVIGTGAMIAMSAHVPACVEPFAWLTDAGAQQFRIEKFLEIMRTAMGRRGIDPSDAYCERVTQLHAGRV